MPQYLSPGVYVEEVDAGPKPIEGVSTSVAGAVGVTARGPDRGKPVLVTSLAEYLRKFGGPIAVDALTRSKWSDDPQLGEFWTFPLAVKGFFDNGGQQLYVKRVVATGASASEVALGKGVMTFITKNALAGATTLKLDNLSGIANGTELNVSIDGSITAVTVSDYDSAGGTVTFAPGLPARAQGNRDFVQIKPAAAATGASVAIQAKSRGAWGNALRVRARVSDGGSFAVMADPTLPNNVAVSTTISSATAWGTKFDVTAAAGIVANDLVLVNGTQYTVSSVAGNTLTVTIPIGNPTWSDQAEVKKVGAATTTKIDGGTAGATFKVLDTTGFAVGDKIDVNNTQWAITVVDAATKSITVGRLVQWTKAGTVIRVRVGSSVNSATPSLFVWNASSLYANAFVEIEDAAGGKKYVGTIDDITGNKVTIDLGAAPGAAFALLEGQKLRVLEATVDVAYAPSDGPETIETIDHLRLVESEPGDPMFIGRRLGDESDLVQVKPGAAIAIGDLTDFPLAVVDATATPPAAVSWATLGGGDDALGSLDVDAFVGLDLGPGQRTGIQALEEIDDISITVAPSIWSSLVQNALIQQAELLKYRFAILDPRPVKPTDIDVIDEIKTFRSGFDTKYAALYFPRIEVRDPWADTTVALGPSAHMAGLYARVDIERGVHKAPANEVINGLDTSAGNHGLEVEITKREQDLLNPIGINAIRFFPNRATRVWGARTLSSDGAWKYINVRRIFIFVERSIDVGTQWVVFEPNDEKTWARVRQSITNFLTTVWRSGALFGTKADEAFFVRCDRTTMTQDDIDNGRLICVIGIAPVKPAEFVIFRIQQKLIDQTQP